MVGICATAVVGAGPTACLLVILPPDAEYKEGLTLAQLMPGPLAAQLAIYLGYVHYGVVGATLVGVAFVLPSFLMVVALGWAYVNFGGISWMQAVF